MQKKFVQSSLALTAAAALGLGGAFVAGPAAADKPDLNVKTDTALQTAVHKNLADKNGELASEVGRFGVEGDTLVLGVSEKTDKVKELASKYDNVEVIVDPKFAEAQPQDAKDLVGGAGYLLSVPSDERLISACSTGFAGWDSSGNQVVLTAGHCAVDATTGAEDKILELEKPSDAEAAGGEGFQPAGTGAPGTWGFHQYGSDMVDGQVVDEDKAIDFAVIKVAAGFTSKAEVTDWTTATSDDLSQSTTEMAQVGTETPGATIHKSGRTTGVTEGTVLDDPEALEYANIGGRAVHGFEVTDGAKRFSDHGDSGGAVYQGDTAVGVISGGPEAGGWSWVADLDNSIEKSGESFTFEDPNETPEAPAAPAVVDQTIEPKGNVTGKTVANAEVKVSWTGAADGKATVKADADGKFSVEGPSAEGSYDAKAVATVDGQSSEAAAFKLTVKAADVPEVPEAPVVEDQKVDEGGQITGKTVANAKVELNWKPATDNQSAVKTQAAANGSVTVTADAEGNFTAEAPAEAGTYDYTATATTEAGTSKATSFTVVVEEADDAADAADGDEAEADDDSAANGEDANAKADADGNDSNAGADADAKDAESNADSDGSKDGEAPAERAISISPKEVAASDFVKKDKGVAITVKGFDEGENVSLEVVAGPENVEGITLDETANEDGVAAFSIYGTNASDPSAYLGKYDVQVTGDNDTDDEKALAGSFSVVADEDGNGGGSDDGDGGDGGSDLPRTGAELTGLAAGAGLLVVGGAAVVLTMRRNKKN
ncbi:MULTISPECIES: LPXTG cell wall anchor domain-containing protein [Brevibacterium]|uniref:LPXTG-motif cell wall anchor domain-containing protein n=1 Tax=Brevibacterium antiquum CNRZ 918 TaxID=1255637 RepID=A0A2H1K975_9MICO|nr:MULTISPECIES: LPXTG cell wall anchor domain-containing protein [Brevibacterium]SMX96300.1 LPXTG-motif cell wall anchor domain-containing protein [Brevibacterium antiquum CNRZ 918]HCG55837.1 LPXTG cell wall anchor domain-containing protein [Brevibacterium sp.]